jgi:hypothetical protein
MIFIRKKEKIIPLASFITLQLASILLTTGCSKLIEVNTPTTSIDAKNVYSNNLTASAVLTGIYTGLSASGITGNDFSAIGFTTGLSGDELILYNGSRDIRLKSYYQNNLKNITSRIEFWTAIYKVIYITNLSIEGLNNSSSLAPSVKKQLLGEAKFLRAFSYFYLVNLYGDVPLSTTTDFTTNNILGRSPKEKVWGQIVADLNESIELLSPRYLDGSLLKETPERIRPTRWAAIALLARSYLYTQDWKNAEVQASAIIENTTLYKIDSLNKTFLMNNMEAIWQLQPVNIGSNTEDAKTYIIPSTGPSVFTPVYLSPELLNSFEKNDRRRLSWIDSVSVSNISYYYAAKYKIGTIDQPLMEYNTILRLGEQFLIRAEARAQQNNFEGSCSDLNVIRNRAGLSGINLNVKSLLLTTIYHERQVELFTEWGHRWLDLKRTQTVNDVMSHVASQKGGTWSINWQLFPIPSYDIISNGNLTQNVGY